MSLTTHSGETQASTALISSPPKQRKIDLPVAEGPSSNEVWKWTFTREAIAPCFINDALAMMESTTKETDFYWLGRVPCRSVKIAGLLVGVQVYEKRIRYTVDDGTGVIDCLHKQSPPPRSPVKKLTGRKDSSSTMKSKASSHELKPAARVGNSVIVTGRVVKHRNKYAREIVVDSIEKVSLNNEVQHWAHVHHLHAKHYSLSDPFQIPMCKRPSSPCEVPALMTPTTPVKAAATPRNPEDATITEASTSDMAPHMAIISSAMTSPATAQTTPSTTHTMSPSSSLASSPAKSTATQSPQKLRHPSRLHSRDLNGNTFRIYVKHYMDRMTYVNPTFDADNEFDTTFIDDCPTTPTKPSLRFANDATPRASSSELPKSNNTPRPRISPLSFDDQSDSQRSTGCPMMTGFTLSYLRRVPELADMAKRVVKAVTKRRLREERQKAKEAATQTGSFKRAKPSTGSRTTTSVQVQEKNGPRIKRLFQVTIVQLLKEGSIVLWDGPTHPCAAGNPKEQVSGLWKANVTSTSAESTLLSTVRAVGDDEEDILSEPESNEEAYIPLSPVFLAGIVEEAIEKLTRAPTVPTLIGRKKQEVKRYGATTKEGILAFLRKDDRWRYLSEWNVGEALDVLKVEQRAWCVGRGLWELSL